jgi:flavin reductase (DIM6/NTAB) family NADH-FMN oxidoreductase RutF
MTIHADPAAFRAALSRFASGVTILTMRDADGVDHGMTATAFSSVSLDPPLILACINHAASMFEPLQHAQRFAVNILSDAQQQVSRAFAAQDTDRFGGFLFERGIGDVPILVGAHAHLECRVHARHEAGDHTIIVGEVEACAAGDGGPLVYYRGTYGRFAP